MPEPITILSSSNEGLLLEDEARVTAAIDLLDTMKSLKSRAGFRVALDCLKATQRELRKERRELMQMALFKPEPAPKQQPLEIWKD